MPGKNGMRAGPPRPTREQLRNVLSVALGGCQSSKTRPISTYEPLSWLICDDIDSGATRRTRRSLYRKLVRELSRDFEQVYRERLAAPNGPWTFQDVYESSQRARRCIRSMRWCAFRHLFHLPGASQSSVEAYGAMLKLLIPAADPNNA